LLVDDNALFLEGFRNLLEAGGIAVAGTAKSAREAVEQVRRLQPDVVLMDIQMPGGSGIEATREIKFAYPEMKIVMVTLSETDAHLFDAISAGACGYLLKGGSEEGVVAALEGMARGESPLSRTLAAKLMEEFTRRARAAQPAPEAADGLSERQMEVLLLVAEGISYKEAAQRLGVSESTVKYHMGEIASRLHLQNRAQVIAYGGKLLHSSVARKEQGQ
jgi:two-component system NarL family response regulator